MNGTATERRPGLIGLGAVGYRLAARLLDRFGTLVVLDRDEEPLARALALGGEAATDAVSVGGACDVVLLSLPSPSAVKEVMEGPRGLLASIGAGIVVIDTSTVDPGTNREWAAEAARHGAHHLDAPITCSVTPGGGTAAAACGELTFLVGGDRAALSPSRPARLGQRHEARQQPHLGHPDPGHRRGPVPCRIPRVYGRAAPRRRRDRVPSPHAHAAPGAPTMDEFTEAELNELHADFEAAQRRPLKTRLHSAFIKTYKPVLDDGTVRTFDTMREYRQWCNETLPDWLGYQSTH